VLYDQRFKAFFGNVRAHAFLSDLSDFSEENTGFVPSQSG
jgi:hypothetical protein